VARVKYYWPVIAAIVLWPCISIAQTLTWDASGANPANPTTGSGNWDTTTNANWSNGTTDGTWVNGDAAVFEPTPTPPGSPPPIDSIVTIDDPSGTVETPSLSFPANYTIAAAPGDTLTMVPQAGGAQPSIRTKGGTITAVIAGSDGFEAAETGGNLILTGHSTYAGTTTIIQSQITLTNGASLGNTEITGDQGNLLIDGSASAGTSGPGNSGATMLLPHIDMQDGTIGTFRLYQQSGFTGAALYLGVGIGFLLDLGETAADEVVDSGPGTADMAGGNPFINISTAGDAYLTPGSYTLISVPAGGLTGTFDFPNGQTTETVTVGGTAYTLTLTNSDTAEVLTVLPEPASAAIMTLGGIFLLRRRRRGFVLL